MNHLGVGTLRARAIFFFPMPSLWSRTISAATSAVGPAVVVLSLASIAAPVSNKLTARLCRGEVEERLGMLRALNAADPDADACAGTNAGYAVADMMAGAGAG